MAEVVGRLITDLHLKGTVGIVFLQHIGGGYDRPRVAVRARERSRGRIHRTEYS